MSLLSYLLAGALMPALLAVDSGPVAIQAPIATQEMAKAPAPKHEHKAKARVKKAKIKKVAPKGNVVVLNNEKDLAPYADKKIVIRFFATWCGACKSSKDTYEKYAGRYTDVVFANVDIDQDGDLKDVHNVKAVPTFIFMQEGQKKDSLIGFDRKTLRQKIEAMSSIKKGHKKEVAVPKQVKKEVKPAATHETKKKAEPKVKYIQAIHTMGQLDNALKSNDKVVVKFYARWCGFCRNMKPIFKDLAKQYHGKVAFLKIETSGKEDISAKYEVQGVPKFITFVKGAQDTVIAGADKEKLTQAVKDLSEKAL